MSARVIHAPGSKYTFLEFYCKDGAGKQCHVRLSREKRPADAAGLFWIWDGNVEKPTVQPSVECKRCGRHFTLSRGTEIPSG